MARADLDRVSRAAERVRAVREELLDAILKARRSGETHADIAEAAGMTRQAISAMLKRHGSR